MTTTPNEPVQDPDAQPIIRPDEEPSTKPDPDITPAPEDVPHSDAQPGQMGEEADPNIGA